jgi:hypothetical protein
LERDADTDSGMVKLVADAITLVLEQAEAERDGLKRRMDDVTSRGAVVGGNDLDEFLTRSEERSEMLRNSDDELKRGQERLRTIEANISHFRSQGSLRYRGLRRRALIVDGGMVVGGNLRSRPMALFRFRLNGVALADAEIYRTRRYRCEAGRGSITR